MLRPEIAFAFVSNLSTDSFLTSWCSSVVCSEQDLTKLKLYHIINIFVMRHRQSYTEAHVGRWCTFIVYIFTRTAL